MASENEEIEIRECVTLDELAACVDLQREVFKLPEIEISPLRHFVVTKSAGGFILGAFCGGELIGFVLSVPAFLRGAKAFYSHMTAVKDGYQGTGVGARLKWAQRERALDAGVKFVKWTFEPWKARNAFFNLEKLGAIVTEYQPNFYGIDYATASTGGKPIGLASDRLFAEWHLESDKVKALSLGGRFNDDSEPKRKIIVPEDWAGLVAADPAEALSAQKRLHEEFDAAFADGMVGRGFVRDQYKPFYKLYLD